MDPVIRTHTKEHMSATKEREQKDTMGKETDCNTMKPNQQVLRETYFFVGRAKLDCLEGGTHEETLRPQVNPKSKVEGL